MCTMEKEVGDNHDNRLTTINHLPNEMLHNVFLFLNIEELVPYSRVCRRWKHVISDIRLWKALNFSEMCFIANRRQYSYVPANLILNVVLGAPLLHSLRAVRFDFDTGYSNVISQLADNCPYLQVLELVHCRLSHDTCENIASTEWSLRHLDLEHCNINAKDLGLLLSSHSRLLILRLVSTEGYFGYTTALKQLTEIRCLLLPRLSLSRNRTLQLDDRVTSQLVQLSLENAGRKFLTVLPQFIRLKALAVNLWAYEIDTAVPYIKTMGNLTHLKLGVLWCECDITSHEHNLLIQLFNGLCNLEYLLLISHRKFGDIAARYILQSCGKRLRYLSINCGALLDIVDVCSEMEAMELVMFHSDIKTTLPLTNMTSKMPKLRYICSRSLYKPVNEEFRHRMSIAFSNATFSLQADSRKFPDIAVDIVTFPGH